MSDILVKLDNIEMDYGNKLLFDTDNLEIHKNSKIGIIGSNGSGKSTLAKLIYGDLVPTEGHIHYFSKNIGYLEQVSVDINESIEFDGRLLSELKIPYGTTDYSGGEISKLRLLEVLQSNYDLLILDEPTSHLDKEGIQFLKHMIQNYDNAIILISHNRDILNEFAQEIWFIENQTVKQFSGSFDDYVSQKSLELDSLVHKKESQEKEIKRLEDSIVKAKERADNILSDKKDKDHRSLPSRATREKGTVQKRIMQSAKNMEKRIEDMEDIEIPEGAAIPIFKAINIKEDYNNYPLIFNYVDIKIEDNLLVEKLSLQVKNGEIIGIKGKNGSGKTTIVNTLMNTMKGHSDFITFSKNAVIAFYNQFNYLEFKNNDESLLNHCSKNSSVSKNLLQDMLKDLNFKESDFDRSINTLSGGEAVRVTLFLTLVSGANFLVLDEPTNYLDIETIEVLENYLNAYPGTVLLTSHDTNFIENVCDEVYEIQERKMHYE